MEPNEKIQLDDITFDDVIAGDGVDTVAIDEIEKPVEEVKEEVKPEETTDELEDIEDKVEETEETEDVQKETDDDVEIRENYSECICKLLETIGLKLLNEIGEDKFNKDIMNKIKEYSKDKQKFKARIRFLFMDCLDKKNWQS